MTLLTISNPNSERVGRSSHASLRRAVAFACVALLSPLAAAAQSAQFVRIASDGAAVRSHRHSGNDVVMRAERGTVLEVIHTEGDQFAHRQNNWYWVLLPRDSWGTQRAGWVSGRQVEEVPRAEIQTAHGSTSDIVDTLPPAEPTPRDTAVEPEASPAPSEPEPPLGDVILNFEFAKSEITNEAAARISEALSRLKASAEVSVAVEGHADAIGSEMFNRRLGLERAEAVRRHLAAHHQIPAEQIGVISYGEEQPAASNATAEGRAENRRVVIKVGR